MSRFGRDEELLELIHCWRDRKIVHFGELFVAYKVKPTFTIRPRNYTPSYLPKRNRNIYPQKTCTMFIDM